MSVRGSDADLDALLRAGYRYALALTHRPDAAEDLLQDAWVSVLRARGPHEIGYLLRAIRTRFIDANRRERLVVVEPLDDNEVAVERDLDAPLMLESRALESALAALRTEEREALFLQAVLGHSAQEIAELTERPRGTVLSLLHRAKRKLRMRLQPGREVKP